MMFSLPIKRFFLLNCNTMLILFTLQSPLFCSLVCLVVLEDAQLFTSILLVVCVCVFFLMFLNLLVIA